MIGPAAIWTGSSVRETILTWFPNTIVAKCLLLVLCLFFHLRLIKVIDFSDVGVGEGVFYAHFLFELPPLDKEILDGLPSVGALVSPLSVCRRRQPMQVKDRVQ